MTRGRGLSLNVKFMFILLLVSIIPTLLISISSLGGYNQIQNRFMTDLASFETNYTLTSDRAEVRALDGARAAVIDVHTEELQRYNTRVATGYADMFASLEDRTSRLDTYLATRWTSFSTSSSAPSFDGVIRDVADGEEAYRNRLSHVGAFLATAAYDPVSTAVFASDRGWAATADVGIDGAVTDTDWYVAAAAADGPTVFGPVTFDGQESLVVASSVDRADGRVGVVALVVPVARLEQSMTAGNTSLVLVDEETDVVHAEGEFTRFDGRSLLEAGSQGVTTLAGRLSSGGDGLFNISYSGREHYIAYTQVGDTRFRTAAMRGTESMFADTRSFGRSITSAFVYLDSRVKGRILELRTALRSNLLGIVYKYAAILVMLVLAVMVAGFYFARAVTQPVRRLKEKAELVSRGAVEEDIQIKTGDELEELATAFNRVIHTIKILQGRDMPAGGPEATDVDDEKDDDD